MNIIKWLFLFFLPYSVFAKDIRGNLGLGGTKLFNTSLSQGVLFNPSNNPQKFTFSIDTDLLVSDSLYSLSKEVPKIHSGTYQERLSPYYGQKNRAEGVGGLSFGYKGVSISPLLFLATGDASLNNPAYSNAGGLISIGQGWGVGYGNKKDSWSYGFSRSQFYVKTLESSVNVLRYTDGVVENKNKYTGVLWGFALGYDFRFLKLVSTYQTTNLKFIPNQQLNLGFKSIPLNNLTALVEIHKLDTGLSNIENQLHIGFNYQVLKFINLEAGLNQLYPTYGVRLKTKIINLYYERGGSNSFEQYRNQYNSTKVGLSLGWNLP